MNYGRCALQCGQAVSDTGVICYGQLCVLRYIYYTEDALLKVMDHMKCVLVQLALVKQHNEREREKRSEIKGASCKS